MFLIITFAYILHTNVCIHISDTKWDQLYGAFHNVLRDYKYLYQENQRTYLNGIVHSHRKTEKVFFRQLKMFDVCTTHASTWVHRYSALLQWSTPKGHGSLYQCRMSLCTKFRLFQSVYLVWKHRFKTERTPKSNNAITILLHWRAVTSQVLGPQTKYRSIGGAFQGPETNASIRPSKLAAIIYCHHLSN
jgi:hypothetical protein